MRPLLVLAAATVAASAAGQSVPSREPSGTHVFPAGARRGTTVKVRVGGECFPPGMRIHLVGDGVNAPPVLGPALRPRYEPDARRPPRDADAVGAATAYPREWESEITVAADAEPGVRLWRASGGWGGTRPRPFVVGDLPEFVETEPNSRPDRAERVTLPVVVNGQIAGERDEDYFVLAAAAGDVVTCDVMAARIGSPLDPVVTITDAAGARLPVQEVRVGADPVVAFRAPAAGDYRVHVANLGYPGGPAYVYRLTLTAAPHAPFAFPPAARAGAAIDVDLYTLTGGDGFRVVRERVAFPERPGPFRLRGVTPLFAAPGPELFHRGGAPLPLDLPAAVCGRFAAADAEDWYSFAAKKGEMIAVACEPFPPGSAALPVVALLDAGGTERATAATTVSDAAFEWTAPADGTYRLRARDVQHGTRGGPEFGYRLSVRRAVPDFSLRLDPEYVNVVQGGKTELDLTVRRAGGFNGPIELAAAGLPDGVTLDPPRVPEGVTRFKLGVAAKADARPTDAVLRLTGRAVVAGAPVERAATVTTFAGAAEALALTVQHKPVFRLTCNEAYQYAHRGTVYPYAMTVERLDGFDGPITLQLCDRQVQDLDGIAVEETVIPPGATTALNRVRLPETMFAGVQHHSRPYAQAFATFTDKWGQKQTLLAVSDKRCMIRTLPPVARLRAEAAAVEVAAGAEVECRLVLERTPNFPGPATVELVGSPGCRADRVHLEAGATAVTVRVRADAGWRPRPDETLRFRATGSLPSGATLWTEAAVAVRVK
jgi:hypothetical protein